MATIRVEKTIKAPIDRVFEVATDHGAYSRFSGIHSSELAREGEHEPNGVGALRRIGARPLLFEEEITAFERPVRMDYLITKVNAPMRHHGGSMVFEDRGAETHILWTSSFDLRIPVLGRPLAALAARVMGGKFIQMLDEAERFAGDP